ncbi:TadE/TadG family type IV pilus assembly protein [Bradyrhizobium sp.]|uniref:TadE/TadG family type IV pilus assembly protein n=1 Tax=Bradyrhizobium sp. TaxID=376 RepID=UPI003C7588B2
MSAGQMQRISRRMRPRLAEFAGDRRGLAAVEFAMVVPLMLVMFFGVVEFSSGVAVDRKVTLVARTLSDLTSQSTSVTDTDIAGFIITANAILTPYSATPLRATITELYIDPLTHAARVQWSKGSAPRAAGSPVSIPAALRIDGTYLIFSEVSYLYVPTVGYVMARSGITLSDFSYTRPRQSSCVLYSTTVCPTT